MRLFWSCSFSGGHIPSSPLYQHQQPTEVNLGEGSIIDTTDSDGASGFSGLEQDQCNSVGRKDENLIARLHTCWGVGDEVLTPVVVSEPFSSRLQASIFKLQAQDPGRGSSLRTS